MPTSQPVYVSPTSFLRCSCLFLSLISMQVLASWVNLQMNPTPGGTPRCHRMHEHSEVKVLEVTQEAMQGEPGTGEEERPPRSIVRPTSVSTRCV